VRQVQNRADYAAMLEQLDSAIGRVLDAVDKNGLRERTAVIFLSDNGGLSTAEGRPTSNLPYRGGKGWPYEGGIRTPLLMRIPGMTPPGSLCSVQVMSTDFYPTLLQLAGLPLFPEQHMDGQSLMPILGGHGELAERHLYWHYPHYGNQGGAPFGAIRSGDYKLIEWYEDDRIELYDVVHDISETSNLAGQKPELVNLLQGKLHAWRTSVHAVMPTPNPNGRREEDKFRPYLLK
jgi:arylsulfatase A-like enzyme